MAQRRIAFTSEESLLLTFERGVIYAYEAVDGSLKWQIALDKTTVVAIVYAANSALGSDVAAGPWRSPASASTAIALDAEGTLHAIDAVLGRVLGTVPHEGLVPVGLASGGDALAVAFEDRVIVHRGATKNEVMKRASALAFSRDGLTIAIGTARGDLFFYDVPSQKLTAVEPPGGTIADIAPRPGGGWLVSSERGMTAVHSQKIEKQLNGQVNGVVTNVAGKQLAVHRSEASVVLYHWPPTTPIGRVSATGGTIRDVAFGADNKVGIAMAGGGGAIVDTETFAVLRTAQVPGEKRARWLVSAESEQARLERTAEQARRAQAAEAKPGNGARFGIGAFLTVAIFVIRLCLVGARASSSYTPSYNYQDYSKLLSCDATCESGRLEDLLKSCKSSQAVPCETQATAAIKAFDKGHCADAKASLNEIDTMLRGSATGSSADPMVNANRLIALQGMDTGCRTVPRMARHNPLMLVHLRGAEAKPEIDDVAIDAEGDNDLYAAPDGTLFLASRSEDDECMMRRKPAKASAWVTDREKTACNAAPKLFGRSANEVYLVFGTKALWRFDGKDWKQALSTDETMDAFGGTTQPQSELLVGTRNELARVNPKTFETVSVRVANDDASVPNIATSLFPGATGAWSFGPGETSASHVYKWNGKGWTERGSVELGSMGKVEAFVQAPGGHLYISGGDDLFRSTNEGATWTKVESGPVTAEHLWARSNTDVFASGIGGITRFDGKTWKAIFPRAAAAMTGDTKDLHVIVTTP